jgi:hypothetical protein
MDLTIQVVEVVEQSKLVHQVQEVLVVEVEQEYQMILQELV